MKDTFILIFVCTYIHTYIHTFENISTWNIVLYTEVEMVSINGKESRQEVPPVISSLLYYTLIYDLFYIQRKKSEVTCAQTVSKKGEAQANNYAYHRH